MIKCDVKVCATINHAASVKNGKEGVKYLSFGVKLPIEGRNGESRDLDIGVTIDAGKGRIEDFFRRPVCHPHRYDGFT